MTDYARQRDHDAVEASERRLRAVVEGMPVLMDAFDANGRIVAWNAECERVSGYAAAEIIANPQAMTLLYPDAEYRELMLAEAERRRNEVYQDVWELTAKDGSRRTIEWHNLGARIEIPGWLEWSIGIDITERRRLEVALRGAALAEQRRLGHELHDGLGQELTGLSMLARGLAHRHGRSDPALAGELRQLADIAAAAVASCRNIARGLAPVAEPREGLHLALRELVESCATRDGESRVVLEVERLASSRISLEACNHLYRIAQEALNNALKHSGAREVRLRLSSDIDSVRLEVTDDGCGIAPAAPMSGGMGLQIMRDRATSIGARFMIGAGARGGTVVSCELPNRDPERPPRRE